MPKTFNPKDVVVIFGAAIISGFADGTFIEAERSEDAFTMSSGADGEVTRVGSANRSGTVTLTLAQSSASNDVLSLIAKGDELSGTGVLPLNIKDANGRTTIVSAFGWIRRVPSTSFSKDIETREWIIDCDRLQIFVGGNNG